MSLNTFAQVCVCADAYSNAPVMQLHMRMTHSKNEYTLMCLHARTAFLIVRENVPVYIMIPKKTNTKTKNSIDVRPTLE